jgi:hypothetical protein
MGTLHEDLGTFITVSRRILLRMTNVSEKNCREIQNTNFILINFFPKNLDVYEIMLKSKVEPDRPDDNIIRRMRIAC